MPRRRWFTLGILLIASFVLCYYFPLIHVPPSRRIGDPCEQVGCFKPTELKNPRPRDPTPRNCGTVA